MYAIQLLLIFLATTLDLSIEGVVRARGTFEPVPGVLVELADEGILARTDSMGAYKMHGVLPGSHRLRFSRLGYRSFTTEVSVVDRAALHVDVNLTVDPQWLDTMRVIVAKTPAVTPLPIRQALEPGSFDLNMQSIANSPLTGRADILKDLAASPDVQMDPDAPLGLYVRGGAPDQNLVRVNGVPVRTVAHSGETFSTIDADLVRNVTLHAGAPSASMGGAISSVVDIQTLDAPGLSLRAGIDQATMRASGNIPLTRDGKAGLSVAAGKSYEGVLRLIGENDGAPTAWNDAFIGAHLSGDAGMVKLFMMTSEDALSVQPLLDCDLTHACTQHAASTVRTRNFLWSGSTVGAQLSHKLGARSSAALRMWRGTSAAHLSTPGPLPIEPISGELLDRGMIAELVTRRARAQFKTGVEVETFHAVCTQGEGATANPALLGVCRGAQRARTGSAYVESTLELSDHVVTRVGARASVARGLPLELEPRIVVEGSPAAWLHFTAGYALSHQLLQSLRNYESPLADVIGAEIPVLADGFAIPVAESRDISATARIDLQTATVLQLDAYARVMTGIFARASDGLFTIDDPASGRERARGIGVSLQHTGRVTVVARYSAMFARMRATDLTFAPRGVPAQTAALGIRYRLSEKTTVRGSSWLMLGRTTRALKGQVEAEWEDPLSRVREISGSGSLDMAAVPAPLPNYLRFDLGIDHELKRVHGRDRLRVALNVDNVLHRSNVSTWLRSAAQGNDISVRMIPLSASVALHWNY